MIELKNLTLNVGTKVLLDEASVRLGDSSRVGLIGRNGAGKSSLIKLLLGELQQDGGDLVQTTALSDVGYLAQHLPDSHLSALAFVKAGDAAWVDLQERIVEAEAGAEEKLAELYNQLQLIDGYTIDARAAKILKGLGFSEAGLQQTVSSFSGGWQMRLQLARVLISRAKLLLLDEPTNHLDINAILWLGRWLKSAQVGLLVISHDRDFLDEVCTHILHLDQKNLTLYSGNYSLFTRQYAEAALQNERKEKKSAEKRAHLNQFIERFRAKATKAKQVQSRVKALEKIASSSSFQSEQVYQFDFSSEEVIDGPVINLAGDLGYGDDAILKGVSFSLHGDERVGVLGQNGQGKSTFLKTLSGKLKLVQGDICHHGGLRVGYYAQNQADAFSDDDTLLAIVLRQHKNFTEGQARKFLGRYGFQGERVYDSIAQLSGGERSRLALGLLALRAPHLLILDEPTNHLDLEMKESLIVSLLSFKGAVILVSHDRHFMNSVVNRLACVRAGKLFELEGFSDYERLIDDKPARVTEKKPAKAKQKTRSNQTELDRIEKKINTAKQVLKDLEAKLTVVTDYQSSDFFTLTDEYKKLQANVERLEGSWLKKLDAD